SADCASGVLHVKLPKLTGRKGAFMEREVQSVQQAKYEMSDARTAVHFPHRWGERDVRSLAGGQPQIVAVSDNYRRRNQKKKRQRQQRSCSDSSTFPFFKSDAPKAAEDDDAGHVQRPAGEAIAVYLTLVHGVEEELEIPRCACQRA